MLTSNNLNSLSRDDGVVQQQRNFGGVAKKTQDEEETFVVVFIKNLINYI
jgi:hypothetical protein